jgi:hypothetical protein
VLPCLNSGGVLRRLIQPRWIGLAAVQCALLWSIPQTGVDLPQPRQAAITLSRPTSQAPSRHTIDISVASRWQLAGNRMSLREVIPPDEGQHVCRTGGA